MGRLTEARKKSKKTGKKKEKSPVEQAVAIPETAEEAADQTVETVAAEEAIAETAQPGEKESGTPQKTEEFAGFDKFYADSAEQETASPAPFAENEGRAAPAPAVEKAGAKSGGKYKLKLPTSGTADEIFAYLQQQENATVEELTAEPIAALPPEAEQIIAALPESEVAREQDFYSFLSNEENRSELEAEDLEDLLQLVGFRLKSELFGIEISQVKEITRLSAITIVPNTPGYLLGVINLRGVILPVVDLKQRLMKRRTETDARSRVVIVENGSRTVGLIVESIDDVYQVPLSRIEEPPEEIININERYVSGVARTDGPLIVLLNVAGLLARDETE